MSASGFLHIPHMPDITLVRKGGGDVKEHVQLEDQNQEAWFLWRKLRVKLVYVNQKDWEQEIRRLRGQTD